MMRSSFTIMRVRGIPIGAHWSWLLVFGLVVWSLSVSVFPAAFPGLGDTAYYAMGAAAAVLFFGSILLHELGHAFRALREGIQIEGISLWLLGGVARFTGMFPSPGAEFRIAAAGPLVSLGLAAGFSVLALAGRAAEFPEAWTGVLSYVARINGLVVGFNLIPALPLDGGRILRAWLWHRQGSYGAATRSAAKAGTAFGRLLIAIGVLELVTGRGSDGGLWLVFLGWFLTQAARQELEGARIHEAMGGRPVGQFMTPDPETVAGGTTVADWLQGPEGPPRHTVYPVVEGGRVVGLLEAASAREVPEGRRATTIVADIMVREGNFPVLDPDADMLTALPALDDDFGRAVVVRDGHPVGILAESDALRAIEEQKSRGAVRRPATRRAGALVWIVVAAAFAGAGGLLYRPPVVVLEPGATLNVVDDIEIQGRKVDPINGEYLLTSVRLVRPNALQAAYALVVQHRQVLSLSEVFPGGVDQTRFFRQQRQIFRESRLVAAAAGARAAGLRVATTGDGAIVTEVLPDSPAARVLEPGDVIVEVDGRDVDFADDLPDLIRSRPVGTRFRLAIERESLHRTVRLRSTSLSAGGSRTTGIGVVIATRNFDIDLPFEVSFQQRNIGGPSAGLVYALAVADLLDPIDYAQGESIAATGTIDATGLVGPVGGVGAKAVAVTESDARLFLVPEGEVPDVTIAGLEVLGVSSLDDALRALESSTSS